MGGWVWGKEGAFEKVVATVKSVHILTIIL